MWLDYAFHTADFGGVEIGPASASVCTENLIRVDEVTESTISKFGNVQTSVNMSMADESDLVGIELRYPDGRAWSGGADFGHVREPLVIGQSEASQ
jgi:hypothetical protein